MTSGTESKSTADRPAVIIAGGGPVGMMLALELGRRNVRCVLFNDKKGIAESPKANATSPRSMEHLRRFGIARKFRERSLPADYPTDITYFTRFLGYELARLKLPCWRDAVAENARGEGPWASPEPAHRGSQLYLEAALFDRLRDFPSIDVRFGRRVVDFVDLGDGVRVRTADSETGDEESVTGSYLVGCDGGSSPVRKKLGIELAGDSGIVRAFMGGSMLAAYVRMGPDPNGRFPPRSWQYWAVNAEVRALCCAIDGGDKYVVHVQLPVSRPLDAAYVRDMVERAAGGAVLREIISFVPWTAGFRLLAQAYGSGRVFIAGDAAHLFTPTGGLGMNTGIDDAVNLAWKLAAVANGWADERLLASYESERRPIGARNLSFSKAFADSVGLTPATPAIETDTAEGREERARVGAHLYDHARREFLIPGIHLGMRYEDSPVIRRETGAEPADPPNQYHPTARPGHRAPHAWLAPGEALFDRFGSEFTLLHLHGDGRSAQALATGFAAHGVPLSVQSIARAELRELYGADLVLIRPDQHVAWRGNSAPGDAASLVDRVRGVG